MKREDIKQALISIFVGACVAFLTTLLQGVLGWLQSVPVEAPAIIAGMTKYGGYLLSQQPPLHG